MVHSICIYVILFMFLSFFKSFIYATACRLPKPVSLDRFQLAPFPLKWETLNSLGYC